MFQLNFEKRNSFTIFELNFLIYCNYFNWIFYYFYFRILRRRNGRKESDKRNSSERDQRAKSRSIKNEMSMFVLILVNICYVYNKLYFQKYIFVVIYHALMQLQTFCNTYVICDLINCLKQYTQYSTHQNFILLTQQTTHTSIPKYYLTGDFYTQTLCNLKTVSMGLWLRGEISNISMA